MDKPANRFYDEQRVEIKPGWYGGVEIRHISPPFVGLLMNGVFGADGLREAAHLFNQLAEALER